MTDWTPPEAMVKSVAFAMFNDGRADAQGPDIYEEQADWWEECARAALAASPIRELVEALEVMWCELNWPKELNIYEKVNRAINARALCWAALARARGETK